MFKSRKVKIMLVQSSFNLSRSMRFFFTIDKRSMRIIYIYVRLESSFTSRVTLSII